MRKNENPDDQKYLARVENVFVEKAHYNLPPAHQKILLYAIANIDPTKDDFEEIYLPIRDVERLLSVGGKRQYRNYEYINLIFEKLASILISFDSDIEHNGVKLKGHFSLIQGVRPVTINDRPYMSVLFGAHAKPFVLRLNQYVKINLIEVAQLKTGHAIRLFQAFKAIRNKQRLHHKISIISYKLDELKKLLGVDGKYSHFRDFNKRVLKKTISEINAKTSINIIKVGYGKNGRKVTKLIFHVIDQKQKDINLSIELDGATSDHSNIGHPSTDSISPVSVPLLEMKTETEKKQASKPAAPTQSDIDQLTKAEWTAYYFLTDTYIYSSIAMKMIKGIQGTIAKGYEDVFIKYAWDCFLTRTIKYENINESNKEQCEARAGAFRMWWNQDCFNSNGQGLWSSIIEQINFYKKTIADTAAYDNRELAKGMTKNDFVKYYRANIATEENDQ